jgi:hypothetical protein
MLALHGSDGIAKVLALQAVLCCGNSVDIVVCDGIAIIIGISSSVGIVRSIDCGNSVGIGICVGTVIIIGIASSVGIARSIDNGSVLPFLEVFTLVPALELSPVFE